MNNTRNSTIRPLAIPVLAAADWLLVLPAAGLLVAAAARLMQPAGREPAHTIGIIYEWAGQYLTPPVAGVIFLALPALGLGLGNLSLARAWRSDPSLRQDVLAALALLRRRWGVGLLAAATLAGGAILAAVIAHLIVG